MCVMEKNQEKERQLIKMCTTPEVFPAVFYMGKNERVGKKEEIESRFMQHQKSKRAGFLHQHSITMHFACIT